MARSRLRRTSTDDHPTTLSTIDSGKTVHVTNSKGIVTVEHIRASVVDLDAKNGTIFGIDGVIGL